MSNVTLIEVTKRGKLSWGIVATGSSEPPAIVFTRFSEALDVMQELAKIVTQV